MKDESSSFVKVLPSQGLPGWRCKYLLFFSTSFPLNWVSPWLINALSRPTHDPQNSKGFFSGLMTYEKVVFDMDTHTVSIFFFLSMVISMCTGRWHVCLVNQSLSQPPL